MDGRQFSWARRVFVLSALALAAGCGESTASASGTPAGGPAPGLRLTVDGPAFGGPVRFAVPDGAERLNASIHEPGFTLMFRPKAGVLSEDGKHRLDMVLVRTSPGRAGEFTQASGVEELTLDFVANVNTPQSQNVSMAFRHRGESHPARVELQRFDAKASPAVAAGQFTGRLQRTNNKHKHEFYEARGDFQVRN